MEGVNTWDIVHVPSKPRFPPDNQPTVNVFASAIDPKFANSIVRRLNQIAPLENLRHVKRVRKERLEGGKFQLSVILCLARDGEDHLKTIPADMLELTSSYQLSAFITKVCGFPASSKEEWEEQCKLWPTSYHPPTYNIDGITGFSEEDAQSVCSFTRFALQLAAISGVAQVHNAAVIVDPSVKQVIASACDDVFYGQTLTEKTNSHNSCHEQISHHHIDLNGAATQTAPCSNGKPNELKHHYGSVSCLHPWQWSKQQAYTNSCYWHPLRHAAIAAIEYSAARDRQLYPGPAQDIDGFSEMEQVQSSLEDSPLKRQKTAKDKDDARHEEDDNDRTLKLPRPYLCTGYDIYLVWEPCVMCAMALVHQRVRRIFFVFPNTHAGALGSVHRLQGEESLNHHYAVFRVMVPEESLAIVK
uniref:CMP/dCMP-type deaminase domain-containing protein n=1 Tax=Kalanchoe fedtschenkoi TaxID=63787 RepID=A0A7N0UCA0_KALFE